jgi:phenylalanine-4-hydroxylase
VETPKVAGHLIQMRHLPMRSLPLAVVVRDPEESGYVLEILIWHNVDLNG